jgi:hypothetical protein
MKRKLSSYDDDLSLEKIDQKTVKVSSKKIVFEGLFTPSGQTLLDHLGTLVAASPVVQPSTSCAGTIYFENYQIHNGRPFDKPHKQSKRATVVSVDISTEAIFFLFCSGKTRVRGSKPYHHFLSKWLGWIGSDSWVLLGSYKQVQGCSQVEIFLASLLPV